METAVRIAKIVATGKNAPAQPPHSIQPKHGAQLRLGGLELLAEVRMG
jgi:hypothetical protein